jgi:ribosomal-protein-alanine N-acetyltransferase
MTAILETVRLRIRPWTLDDAEAAFAIYGDPEVARYLGSPNGPDKSVEESRSILERVIARYAQTPGMGFWAVVEKATGDVIGGAILAPLQGDLGIEVGYHLGRRFWGQGYATEIARGCLRYGFEQLRLDRIIAIVFPANLASRRVLEKAGLTFERPIVYAGFELDLFGIENPTSNET